MTESPFSYSNNTNYKSLHISDLKRIVPSFPATRKVGCEGGLTVSWICVFFMPFMDLARVSNDGLAHYYIDSGLISVWNQMNAGMLYLQWTFKLERFKWTLSVGMSQILYWFCTKSGPILFLPTSQILESISFLHRVGIYLILHRAKTGHVFAIKLIHTWALVCFT